MRLLSGHILPRNASNVISSHLDFKNFPGGEIPGSLLLGRRREGEVMGKIKGFLPLREVKGGKGQGRDERDGRGKGGEGMASGRGGDLAPRS